VSEGEGGREGGRKRGGEGGRESIILVSGGEGGREGRIKIKGYEIQEQLTHGPLHFPLPPSLPPFP